MTKKILCIILVVSIFLLLVIGAITLSHNNRVVVNPTISPTEIPSRVPSTTSTTMPSQNPTDEITLTPQTSQNIKVLQPISYQTIGKTFTVTGSARVFENVVSIRLSKTANKNVLLTTTVMAQSPDVGQFGTFTKMLDLSTLSLENGTELVLEVYQVSPKDGSDIDVVTIPLIYKQ